MQQVPLFCRMIEGVYEYPSSRFIQNICGLEFRNPVGLAAGFDKNASICDGMAALGFGFLELGSVTNKKSAGNPFPRMFRLQEDRALINRMGLNNHGPYQFLSNYKAANTKIPRIVNIAKTNDQSIVGENAVQDMVDCYRCLGEFASLVVFNLSCPNTEDGRTFEDPELISNLLSRVMEVKHDKSFRHAIFIKFSNDVDFEVFEKLLLESLRAGVSGFVVGNTSVQRVGLKADQNSLSAIGKGGLSGAPVYQRALDRVSFAYRKTEGKLPIIGVGGIETGEQLVEMIRAGASLVELYTALVYHGPSVVHSMLSYLESYMVKNSILSVKDLVGQSHCNL